LDINQTLDESIAQKGPKELTDWFEEMSGSAELIPEYCLVVDKMFDLSCSKLQF
jgi:hypothetical protein